MTQMTSRLSKPSTCFRSNSISLRRCFRRCQVERTLKKMATILHYFSWSIRLSERRWEIRWRRDHTLSWKASRPHSVAWSDGLPLRNKLRLFSNSWKITQTYLRMESNMTADKTNAAIKQATKKKQTVLTAHLYEIVAEDKTAGTFTFKEVPLPPLSKTGNTKTEKI